MKIGDRVKIFADEPFDFSFSKEKMLSEIDGTIVGFKEEDRWLLIKSNDIIDKYILSAPRYSDDRRNWVKKMSRGEDITFGISYAKRLPKDSADAQNMIKNAIDVDYVAIGSIKLDKN